MIRQIFRLISSAIKPLGLIPIKWGTRTTGQSNAKYVFTQIYKKNAWGSKESFSGKGSDNQQTLTIVELLPKLLAEYGVSSLLDIPCGDFNWMKNIDLNNLIYLGADIVDDLVEINTKIYGNTRNRSFHVIDLIKDDLPDADLMLCRDCLVHLSYTDIRKALKNICASNIRYLLTTTFPTRENQDIATGQWRPLNLEAHPFFFPKPIAMINENCSESDGAYSDKSLALWDLCEIRRMWRQQVPQLARCPADTTRSPLGPEDEEL